MKKKTDDHGRSVIKVMAKKKAALTVGAGLDQLLGQLRLLIQQSRQQAVRVVDTVHVRTCWEVGRHIVEFEQGGSGRARYGASLMTRLAERLSTDFGNGFDERNLRNMRLFYQVFPIWNAVRSELSWTHYRLLLRVDNIQARDWYLKESVVQNWSSRALERQISTLYYERLLASRNRKPVRSEANRNVAALEKSPRDFVRDPVLLEFLGLPRTGRLLESCLEQGLIEHLQSFLLELGKGFGRARVDYFAQKNKRPPQWQ
jgi:predicted nuclease of restriction endonuclease-like (RecB) superfamily